LRDSWRTNDTGTDGVGQDQAIYGLLYGNGGHIDNTTPALCFHDRNSLAGHEDGGQEIKAKTEFPEVVVDIKNGFDGGPPALLTRISSVP